ncbi:MAG: AAA family ATPase [Bryobacteraceae bacterium]
MSVLQEILSWANGLPPWQSDAVARLLTRRTLTTKDVEDLYALLKTAHGISDPKGRTPKPLSADEIPVHSDARAHVELHAIKTMRNVNAIAENQRLEFEPSGLTVIYGDNGSGKSGYSRVLKRACRARDQAELIHPNANLPSRKTVNAEAAFEIAVNGEVREVHWTNGLAAPSELSTLTVFDSRCATHYLSHEDDFSYVPYGLSVFEGLAGVCSQFKGMLEDEQRTNTVDFAIFVPLRGSTAVGNLIDNLSAKTTEAQIDRLAVLSDDERTTHIRLEKSLRESNPAERARQVRVLATRIENLATTVADKTAVVGAESLKKLQNLADEFRIAQNASALAAMQFKEDQRLLPGTGGEAWRALFESARNFALESHPGQPFPTLGDQAQCPLCQQPLADGATRLVQFEAFVQRDAEKTAQRLRAALLAAYSPFIAQSMALGLDDVTFAEIERLDPQLAIDTRSYETALTARQLTVKEAVASHKWAWLETEPQPNNPASRLQVLSDHLNAEAETLEKAADEKVRAELESKNNELRARLQLSQMREAVSAAVTKLQRLETLTKCLSAIKTKGISTKASEMAERVVSAELADALNREFKFLAVHTLQVSLKSKADKGKALHKLRLELDPPRNPLEILSEGEQRAIAIGSFLAEVGLSGHAGGIILDDPVSSLDHRRREKLADRLAAEAGRRQVIIFTHDIYYLCLLIESAERRGIKIKTQSLTRTQNGCGVADSELPFEGLKTSARIGFLRSQHQMIGKLFKQGAEMEHRRQTIDAYVKLRMAWERAVEEILFKSVILRFRKGVETNRLAEVSVEDSDYAAISDGMTKCSNYAHDKALEVGISVPDPDELLADITALETWRNAVDQRGKVLQKKRKASFFTAKGS